MRKTFGLAGEFVDLPITHCNPDWEDKEVRVSMGDETSANGLRMRLTRLHHSDANFTVYSCGGLLLRCKGDYGASLCISVSANEA